MLAVFGAFGFIIFIHELGHWAVARRVGIRCPEFAIGFGKILYSFRWKGTRWGLRLVPVGGYVQMIGEDPQADQGESWHEIFTSVVGDVDYPTMPETVLVKIEATPPPEGCRDDWEQVREHLQNQPQRRYSSQEALEGNFNAMTHPQRIAVVLGGVCMNFIAATLIMWMLGFAVGVGDFVPFQSNQIDEVFPNSVAAASKLQADDAVVRVGGFPTASGAELLANFGQYPGRPLEIEVRRNKQINKMKVTPDVAVSALSFRAGAQNVTVLSQIHSPTLEEELTKEQIQLGSTLTAIEGRPVTTTESVVTTLREVLSPKIGQEVSLLLTFSSNGKTRVHTLKGPAVDFLPRGRLGMALHVLNQLVFSDRGNDEVATVTPDSQAARLGILPNDSIYQINNIDVTGYETISRVLTELSKADFSNERTVVIRVLRKDDVKALLLRSAPAATPEEFGISLKPITTRDRLLRPLLFIRGFLLQPYQLPAKLNSGAVTYKEVRKNTSGPLGIMQSIYEMAQQGLPAILFFLAILNAAVGGFNLIPFPALDGMRCLLLFISAARRREFNPENEAIFHFIGLGVLLCFVCVVTLEDVRRLYTGTPMMK